MQTLSTAGKYIGRAQTASTMLTILKGGNSRGTTVAALYESEEHRAAEYWQSVSQSMKQLEQLIGQNPLAVHVALSHLQREIELSWFPKVYNQGSDDLGLLFDVPRLKALIQHIEEGLSAEQLKQIARVNEMLRQFVELGYLYAHSNERNTLHSTQQEMRSLESDPRRSSRARISELRATAAQLEVRVDYQRYDRLRGKYFQDRTEAQVGQFYHDLDRSIAEFFGSVPRPEMSVASTDAGLLRSLFEKAWVGRLNQTILSASATRIDSRQYRFLQLMGDTAYQSDPMGFVADICNRQHVYLLDSFKTITTTAPTHDEIVKACYLYKRTDAKKDAFWQVLQNGQLEEVISRAFDDDVFRAIFSSPDRNYLNDEFYTRLRKRQVGLGTPTNQKQLVYEEYVKGKMTRKEFDEKLSLWQQQDMTVLTKNCCSLFAVVPLAALFVVGLSVSVVFFSTSRPRLR